MADYDFYRSAYLGDTIPGEAFPGMAAQAQAVLDRFKRIYTVKAPGPDGEKLAVCAMADTLYLAQRRRGGVVSSRVGSVSVRYGEDCGRKLAGELFDQAAIYLDICRGAKR